MPPKKKDKAAASGEGDTGEDPEVFLANYKKAAKIFGGEVSNEILDGTLILLYFCHRKFINTKFTIPLHGFNFLRSSEAIFL